MFPGFDPLGFVLGVLFFIGVPWFAAFVTFIFFLSHGRKTSPLEVVDLPAPVIKTTARSKRRLKGVSDTEILFTLRQIEKIQDRFNTQLKE